MLEEEARQAKLAAGRSNPGLSSQEREKIDKIVEEVGEQFLISNFSSLKEDIQDIHDLFYVDSK